MGNKLSSAVRALGCTPNDDNNTKFIKKPASTLVMNETNALNMAAVFLKTIN
jgi:hypothetical protein